MHNMLDEHMRDVHIRRMTLDEYLEAERKRAKVTDEAFGKRVSLSQSQISRLRRGLSRPSLKTIEAIHLATGKKVTFSDWKFSEAAE